MTSVSVLNEESETLSKLLRPATKAEINKALAVLFSALPMQDKGDGGEDMRLAGYHIALEGARVGALEGVVRDVLRGTLPDIDMRFAPTPPQLGKLCRARADDMGHRQYVINQQVANANAPRLSPPEMRPPTEEELRHIEAKAESASRLMAAGIEEGRMIEESNPLRVELKQIAARVRERGYTSEKRGWPDFRARDTA